MFPPCGKGLTHMRHVSCQWSSEQSLDHSMLLYPWLTDAGSFMQRLRDHGVHDAKIHVLRQAWDRPLLDERRELKLDPHRYALIREVFIHSDETIWMYARTIIPHFTLTGREQRYKFLKDRALGSLLFKDPKMTRGTFEFMRLTPEIAWQQSNVLDMKLKRDPVWARRSLFFLGEKPLLLAEFFLPPLEKLCGKI